MADVATPSGAAMFDAGNTEKKEKSGKPTAPDAEAYKAALAKLEKEHKAAMDRYTAAKAKCELATSPKDSPSGKERAETLKKLKEIQAKQGEGKAGRGPVLEKIKKLEDSVRTDQNNLKAAKSKLNYKGTEDIDRAIERLDKEVNGGMMKLVDEKKALAEISSLRKQRKQFTGFDDIQKSIDNKRAEIKKLRDSLDDPEAKALSEEYSKLQKKFDELKAAQDEAHSNLSALRDERSKYHKEQQETYAEIKKLKDEHYQAGRAAQKYEFEQRQKARERKKAENEAYQKGKRMERANAILAEAREPAYLDEIRRANSLLAFLDPSFKQEKAALKAASGMEAAASRKVDDSGMKGTKVVKKEEEDYFAGTGGKKSKGKKNKKAAPESPSTPSTPTTGKFSCPPAVMEDCAAMGIDPPMTASDIPSVTEKVKAKLEHWKSDQDAQTKKNVEKAEKEVKRLEAEEDGTSTPSEKPTTTNGHGETKATAGIEEGGSITNEIELVKGAVADVVADLKGASIEDKA
ncbi:hypothetical protein GLAREA_04089 [Glarea lozoyensis ATCC 20868]|uniref:Nuclear segregation protein BFR1 n=2 Tax=Glarea lozoyensis TaxID=101852 RepID=S3CXQ5_GLAL2|nr:uncharacterized protein GLAREA_04089 [Glarea lozoyensis ATCC 20868]EHL02915.1 hypothetical protein M7I_0881 [Glarea lozoyensis 74030]EPE31122.1 hypothetical protein GLAREA_04089 [Glarea lozoyensis ATCC 20868]